MPYIECVSTPKVFTPAEEKDGYLYSNYLHQSTRVEVAQGATPPRLRACVDQQNWQFKTQVKVPRTGVLLAGIGGNNGSTLACALIAHQRRLSWEDRCGIHHPDWIGSIAVMGTCKLGCSPQGKDIYVPLRSLLPMINPNDLIIGGWDISKCTMSESARRAKVIPLEIQRQVAEDLDKIEVWPGVYRNDFIATNQELRADNIMTGSLMEQVEKLRLNISDFKKSHDLEKIIVVWTGNTERFTEHQQGYHDTAANFLKAIESNHSEISPSSLYATVSEKVRFTLLPHRTSGVYIRRLQLREWISSECFL